MAKIDPDKFSHNKFEYIPDPFSFYRDMRGNSPAFYSETIFGGTWLFFSYEDCLALMKDERLSNARSAVPLWFLDEEQKAEFGDMLDVYERWLAFHDGQRHTRNRRIANHSYQPFDDARLEKSIQDIVDGLLDDAGQRFDLMRDLAFPLPAMVIAMVLGVPVSAHADLSRWTDDIAHLFGSTHVTVEHIRRSQQSTLELAEFLREAAADPANHGGLLHTLSTTTVRGQSFSPKDVTAQAALLLFAGVASIRYLIGNAVVALDGVNPAERARFQDPAASHAAVEEVLRMCTPVQFVGRVASDDFDFETRSGETVRIGRGRPMLLYVASANRDPQIFPDADRMDLTRSTNPHLTFGAGRHLCFGDPLVRQTTRIGLASIYRRYPNLRLLPQEQDWNNNLGFHGLTSLSVSG